MQFFYFFPTSTPSLYTREQFISQMKHLSETIQQVKSDMMTYFDTKVDPILSTLNGIQGSLSSLGEHVSELEQRVAANEDNLNDLSTQTVRQLEKSDSWKSKIYTSWIKLMTWRTRVGLLISALSECLSPQKAATCSALWPISSLSCWGRKTSTLRRLLRGLIATLQSARMTAPVRGPSWSSCYTSRIRSRSSDWLVKRESWPTMGTTSSFTRITALSWRGGVGPSTRWKINFGAQFKVVPLLSLYTECVGWWQATTIQRP